MARSIIAIGGPHGSGKSSVAKRLADELSMNYVSAGSVFREFAKERHITIEEFSNLVSHEPEIDKEIDNRTKELSNIDNTIVDAQLAAHFCPPDTLLKISITASPAVRWKRIAKREGLSFREAEQETNIREKSEKNRFLSLYNIDVADTSFYDIIINTDRIDREETFQICKNLVVYIIQKAKES